MDLLQDVRPHPEPQSVPRHSCKFRWSGSFSFLSFSPVLPPEISVRLLSDSDGERNDRSEVERFRVKGEDIGCPTNTSGLFFYVYFTNRTTDRVPFLFTMDIHIPSQERNILLVPTLLLPP